MLYYVSIKPYNSTVQEFCTVQLRLYGCAGPQTLPKPVRAMESGDNEKKTREQSRSTPVTQTEVTLTDLLHTYAVALSSRAWVRLCCELE